MMTLVPFTVIISVCTACKSLRWWNDVKAGNAARDGYLSGSSETTAIRSTPNDRIWLAICSTVSPPSWRWPPVIATASLNRIL